MPRRRKPEFPLTPSLEKFKYEVADEIAGKLHKKPTMAATQNPSKNNQ